MYIFTDRLYKKNEIELIENKKQVINNKDIIKWLKKKKWI